MIISHSCQVKSFLLLPSSLFWFVWEVLSYYRAPDLVTMIVTTACAIKTSRRTSWLSFPHQKGDRSTAFYKSMLLLMFHRRAACIWAVMIEQRHAVWIWVTICPIGTLVLFHTMSVLHLCPWLDVVIWNSEWGGGISFKQMSFFSSLPPSSRRKICALISVQFLSWELF